MGQNNFVDTPPTPETVDHAYYVHVLLSLMQNEQPLTFEEQEQFITHLSNCLSCQKILQKWLYAELDYDIQHGASGAPLRELLVQLEEIINETVVRTDIGAYIDALMERGEDAANTAFPRLANHLRLCKRCRTEVQEVCTLLSSLE
jgi:hypothetical protein